MRLAFGTFLGLPDPATAMGDADCVRTRWHANPAAAFGAHSGDELVGSNFATNWGSVGFFGPLTIRPDLWDRGIGTRLMEPIMDCFDRWGTKHAGLFTFAQSQKHLGLYQKFGFWPRFLTAIMSKSVEPAAASARGTVFSALPEPERPSTLQAMRQLTDSIHAGLDPSVDVRAVDEQHLGDTVLLWDNGHLEAMAVCHCGPGTEAGSGSCYIKFGAARSGPRAPQAFERLLDACEELAAQKGLSRVIAGANTARHEAYRYMIERGFRTMMLGVVMQRPNDQGYNRAGVYVIDDLR